MWLLLWPKGYLQHSLYFNLFKLRYVLWLRRESISIPRVLECTNIKLLILTLFLLSVAFKNKDLWLPPFGNFLRILLILLTHILSSPGTPITSMVNHLVLHQSSWTHFLSFSISSLFFDFYWPTLKFTDVFFCMSNLLISIKELFMFLIFIISI